MPPKPVMLVILDGFGWREDAADNAVRRPSTRISRRCGPAIRTRSCTPPAAMSACPNGQMGNSEVGHLTIGAGRVIKQELVRIGDAVADGVDRHAAGLQPDSSRRCKSPAAPAI